jgi:serine O-acetyltransferase
MSSNHPIPFRALAARPARQPDAPMKTRDSTFRADFTRYYRYCDGARLLRLLRCWTIPGLQAVAVYRFGQWAKGSHWTVRVVADPLYQLLGMLIKLCWGIALPRSARIGRGLYIGHFGGIHISSAARIGKNCNLSQDVTIGVAGVGDKRGVPIIGDNVYLAPGARVFGPIRIGNNVKIGANAVVYRDIPDNAVVALDPGFTIVSLNGNPNPNQVD